MYLAQLNPTENSFFVEDFPINVHEPIDKICQVIADMASCKPKEVLGYRTKGALSKARVIETLLNAHELGETTQCVLDLRQPVKPLFFVGLKPLPVAEGRSENIAKAILRFVPQPPQLTEAAKISFYRYAVRAAHRFKLTYKEAKQVLFAIIGGLYIEEFCLKRHRRSASLVIPDSVIKQAATLLLTVNSAYDFGGSAMFTSRVQNLIARAQAQDTPPEDVCLHPYQELAGQINLTSQPKGKMTIHKISEQHLASIVKALAMQAKAIVLDCETFGINEGDGIHPWKNRLRLIQLAFLFGDDYRILIIDMGLGDNLSNDLFSCLDGAEDTEKKDALLNEIAEILESFCPVLGHNITFDVLTLATKIKKPIRPKNIIDTMIGAKIALGFYGGGEGYSRSPLFKFGLGEVVQRFAGLDIDKSCQKSDWGCGWLSELQFEYAAMDVYATAAAFCGLVGFMADTSLGFHYEGSFEAWQLENDFAMVAATMTLNGLPCDYATAERHRTAIAKIEQDLLKQWYDLCGLNPTQKQKLKDYCNTKYGLKLTSFTKEAIALHSDIPLIKLSLQLSALKAYQDDVNNFLNSANAFSDKRIRTLFNPITGTGRMSSSKLKQSSDFANLARVKAKPVKLLEELQPPNPREIVRAGDGWSFLVIDLAASHARIAAEVFSDDVAIALQNDDSIDSHSKIAYHVLLSQGIDIPWETISKINNKWPYKEGEAKVDLTTFTPEQISEIKAARNIAKNTFYGWLNGAGAHRVQATIKEQTNTEPSIELCKAAIEGCRLLCPDFESNRKSFMNGLKSLVFEYEGKMLAPIPISQVNTQIVCQAYQNDDGTYEAPYTQSLAAIWSRIEATIMKKAITNLQQKLDDNPEWAQVKIVNFVYDEINIEAPEELALDVATVARDCIEDAFQSILKQVKSGLETDTSKYVCKSWADK